MPYRRRPASWVKTQPADVKEHIAKLAKKGLTPSQIGVTLRDQFGMYNLECVLRAGLLFPKFETQMQVDCSSSFFQVSRWSRT